MFPGGKGLRGFTCNGAWWISRGAGELPTDTCSLDLFCQFYLCCFRIDILCMAWPRQLQVIFWVRSHLWGKETMHLLQKADIHKIILYVTYRLGGKKNSTSGRSFIFALNQWEHIQKYWAKHYSAPKHHANMISTLN